MHLAICMYFLAELQQTSRGLRNLSRIMLGSLAIRSSLTCRGARAMKLEATKRGSKEAIWSISDCVSVEEYVVIYQPVTA